jgi:hypothetical protein
MLIKAYLEVDDDDKYTRFEVFMALKNHNMVIKATSRWKHNITPKRWYPLTKLNGVAYQAN